jgi:hypothetical protein
MLPFLFALAVLAGCPFGPCGGDDEFVVVVEGGPSPDSAWILIAGVEHEMDCR